QKRKALRQSLDVTPTMKRQRLFTLLEESAPSGTSKSEFERSTEVTNRAIELQMREALTRCFGEGGQFRSDEQREIVRSAFAHESPVVGVMAAGGGKSLAYILPALVETDETTVVVAPFRSLVAD